MRIIDITNAKEEQDFAKRAIEKMAENDRYYTYTDGDPKPGCLMAIRWNPFTVLVIKLDDSHDPSCYPVNQFIGKDLPPLKGDVTVTAFP